jgi:hypothetical protein
MQNLSSPPDGTWVPMATVHFAAMTIALLDGWMAVRAER